jgi:hypothetical protein
MSQIGRKKELRQRSDARLQPFLLRHVYAIDDSILKSHRLQSCPSRNKERLAVTGPADNLSIMVDPDLGDIEGAAPTRLLAWRTPEKN